MVSRKHLSVVKSTRTAEDLLTPASAAILLEDTQNPKREQKVLNAACISCVFSFQDGPVRVAAGGDGRHAGEAAAYHDAPLRNGKLRCSFALVLHDSVFA